MEAFDPKYETKTPKGEMNFIGAVRAYFDLYTQHCSENTKEIYIRDYNERIFPIISPSLAVHEYTEETIERYRTQLQSRYNYDDATIRSRYDHLLSNPCEVFFEVQGSMLNPLWGAGFKFRESESETKREKLLKIRKSLTVQEELRAKAVLLDNPKTEDGTLVGLAIMFLAAVRNAEACGLSFGDLRKFEKYQNNYYLRVYETTGTDSNVLKLGGKTSNAPRYVPIPQVLSDFLLRRREYVESMISFPFTDQKGRVHASIDTLPMACRKDRFGTRCETKDLSDAGRNLLRYQLKLSEEQVSGINVLIQEDSEDLGEKEATTYLFRRNMATHLYTLGFDQLQIQYYMGHRLENSNLRRSDFTDEELLYKMSVLLENHPLNENHTKCFKVSVEDKTEAMWENIPDVEIIFDLQEQKEQYYIKIANCELCDAIEVELSGQDCQIEVHSGADRTKQAAKVNIVKKIRDSYVMERNL